MSFAASTALRSKCVGRALFTPGLLSGDWCATVAAAQRVVTLRRKNCMKKVMKFVKPSAPVHPFSCLQLRKRTDYFLIILTILDNYSYNIAPWTFNKRSGSVFSFGIEPCFLILARAIIGTKPLISQTLVQSIFDHFVLQTVKHRIPATVYPYCTLFTRMPDIDGNGLSMQTIDEEEMYHDSPSTLLRSLPCASCMQNRIQESWFAQWHHGRRCVGAQ